jgi:hypothetical protein
LRMEGGNFLKILQLVGHLEEITTVS